MEERVGLVVSSVAQLAEKLEAYVAGQQGMEDVYPGQVKGNKEWLSLFSSDGDLQQAVEKWITQGKVSKLLELWVKGGEGGWGKEVRGGKAAAEEPAEVSVWGGALLDGNEECGSGGREGGGGARGGRGGGTTSIAAQQHVRSEGAEL